PFYGYCRPAAGGRLLFGIETSDREEWRVSDMDFRLDDLLRSTDLRYTEAVLREKIKENFSSYFPPIKNIRWESSKTGLLTFSMDGEPILGPVAEVPGLFVGVAFHSGGFAYNPVSGLLLAELVTDGKTSVNIDAFSPSRFSNEQTEKYLAQTVQQKNVAKRRH
ncbi:MAG: FAD-binding oxidoreductase, partial [Chitinophagaceae bacterium]|nr:FAD-binding oxidoreductase [Chitinophagaceae bacterium]